MAVSDSHRPSPRQRCLSDLSVLLMGSTYPLTNPFPATFPLIPVQYCMLSKIRVCPLILIRLDVVYQGTIDRHYSGSPVLAHHLPPVHDYQMAPLLPFALSC